MDFAALRRAGVLTFTCYDELPPLAFSGVAYAGDDIFIGEPAFLSKGSGLAATVEEGRFCILHNGIFRTDDCGQDCIFYYSNGSRWAASSSFLALVETVRDMGISLTPNPGVIAAGYIRHSVTDQLISYETMAREIHVLPLGHQLVLTPEGLTVQRRERVPSFSSYEEALLSFCQKWAGRLASLLVRLGDHAQIDISGGMDSRTVLALLLNSGVSLGDANFMSTQRPGYEKDYQVACMLAERFGFKIRNKASTAPICDPESAYALWRYGSLGVYYPVYWPTSNHPTGAIHLHGGGGECLRQFFGRTGTAYGNWLRKEAPTDGQAVHEVFMRGLTSIGGDPETHSTMRDYYRHFRARYHFGRNWYKSLSATLVTPLASDDLIEAAAFLTEEEIARNQVLCDIMLLSCPELMAMPFDDPKKAFSREAIEESRVKGLRTKPHRLSRVYADSNGTSQPRKRANTDMQLLLMRDAEALPCSPSRELAIAHLKEGGRFTSAARSAAHAMSAALIQTDSRPRERTGQSDKLL